MLTIGDKAPDLLGRDENGKEIRLSDYKGRKVALYFYPKDNTSGCTAEACSLRDHRHDLRDAGYEVIGVSVQDEASHQKFISKHALNFPLIADTDHRLVEAFGVWQEKSLYGRKYMGTVRATFLIDEAGVITHVFSGKEIKTKIHGEQLMQAIKA